jgi:hypothetical protein
MTDRLQNRFSTALTTQIDDLAAFCGWLVCSKKQGKEKKPDANLVSLVFPG